jgi:cytochrome b6-f complex subunit 7
LKTNCCKSSIIKLVVYLFIYKEKIMGEMVNAIVLSMVLIPVGIALGYFLLKLQGGQEEEEA